MLHKTSTFRRMTNRSHAARRLHIGLTCMSWDALATDVRAQGKLRKGKVHCSCPLCSCKSTKYMNKSTNSLLGYSAADKRKFDALNSSYEEYFAA